MRNLNNTGLTTATAGRLRGFFLVSWSFLVRRVWLRARLPLTLAVAAGAGLPVLLALAVPWAVQGPVRSAVARHLERPVHLDKARFNPFTLTLTLEGLRIEDKPPAPADLVTARRIVVNLSLASVIRAALVLDALHVEAPHVSLTRTGPNHFNVSDLLAPPAREDPPESTPMDFALRDVAVHEGELHFHDLVQGTQQTVRNIEFSLPQVTNFKDARDTAVKPLLSASLHGGQFHLGAESKPFKADRETTLHLKVQNLDLASALRQWPLPAQWHLEQGRLDTQLQLSLRVLDTTQGGLQALAQVQKLQVADLLMRNPQGDSLSWGHADLDAQRLSLGLSGDAPHVQIDASNAVFQNLQLSDGKPLLQASSLQVQQLAIDTLRRSAHVGQLHLQAASLQAHRARDGSVNIHRLLERLSQGQARPAAALAAEPSPAWTFEMARASVTGTSVQWRDESASKPVEAGVKNLRLELENVSTKATTPLRYQFQTELAHGGQVSLEGQAEWHSRQLTAQLKIDDFNLAVLQPYLSQALALQLSKGQLKTQGQLTLQAHQDRPMRLDFKGQSEIADLYTREPDTQEDFLRWKRLTATELDLSVAPLALSAADHISIGGLVLQDLYAKLVISPKGRVNLQDILRLPQGTPPAPATPAPSTPPSAPSQQPRVTLGGVRIAGGRLNFTDQFVKPAYTVNITDLSGAISAVGPQSQPAAVNLQGRIEGDAPITIQGQLNPVAKTLFADITAKARGIDLPTLTPYSAKYIGYAIERGKLSLDVKYRLENGQLTAQNRIFLDQLTFGDPIESPSATRLPVLFAVALLKNSRGEIDLHLPVEGSLKDPRFSIGGVLAQAMGNLIKRAATAPFTLLASVFSRHESGDLGTVDFIPGTAELTPDSKERLDKLAQALVERPGLKLDIIPRIDATRETGDLRRMRLQARVEAERQKHLPAAAASGTPPATTDDIRRQQQDHAQWVQRVYDSTSLPNKPRNLIGLAQKIPTADMESLLMAATVVSDADLRQLAQDRARATRDVLIEKVPSARLFTQSPVISITQKQAEEVAPATAETCQAACVMFALHPASGI